MSDPAGPALPTVAAVVAQLLAADGPSHVEGRYIADASLADRARQRVAERIVRDATRHAAARATAPCPWCALPIAADVPAVTMAGDRLHPVCAEALEVELWGAPVAAPTWSAAFAPIDETDALVVETETGTGEAWDTAYLAGQSVGEQRAEQATTLRVLGRVA